MKQFRIVNSRSEKALATRALEADSFLSRCKGLLGKRVFLEGEGLIIRPCRMVHMFFMQMPIDVVFCSFQDKVLAIDENLKPWKLSSHVPDASYVIELPVGMPRVAELEIGDTLKFEPLSRFA